MRRGHPGIGGWRAENQRHFRPRGGGTPHFRPARSYGLLDTPRFPHPGQRPHRAHTPYSNHSNSFDDHDRSFRNRPSRPLDRNQYSQRQILPLIQRMRHGDVPDHANQYNDNSGFYDKPEQSHGHSDMGDVDLRHPPKVPLNPWNRPPLNYYDDRHQNKHFRHNNEPNKTSIQEYTGHRPPASDHYSGSTSSSIDNSNAFSRSVDDTVDMVKKRLLSRDSNTSQDLPPENHEEKIRNKEPASTSYSNVQQEQPVKKQAQKQRKEKSNCDKIKNKIVHQLFMMDKDKICKLMDNPNSSTKFEYAISSLVNESQNSFNRHLRSQAEKSLCSSSSEFIHNDTNTIYEDTFMRQMQCILDPQDTVLLEDIKPMVLAELSKVLQLDDFDQRPDFGEENTYHHSEQVDYEQYNDMGYENFDQDYDTCTQTNNNPYYDLKPIPTNYEPPEPSTFDTEVDSRDSQPNYEGQLFERRPARKSKDYSDERIASIESRRRARRSIDDKASEDKYRRSATPVPIFESKPVESSPENIRIARRSVDDRASEDKYKRSGTPVPCFDPNVEQFSEEEDPFAELDKQYHVDVDPSFIETYDLDSPRHSNASNRSISPEIIRDIRRQDHTPQKTLNERKDKSPKPIIVPEKPSSLLITPDKPSKTIKQEIDNQLQNMAKSPLKFTSPVNKTNSQEQNIIISSNIAKQELLDSSDSVVESTPTKPVKFTEEKTDVNIKKEQCTESKIVDPEISKSESLHTILKSSTPSRKRSIDQVPSHRKEKRKKSESSAMDINNPVFKKTVVISINDCVTNPSEKCEPAKQKMPLPENNKSECTKESKKDNKKPETTDKTYSDKYVKRKEMPKTKDKDSEHKKKSDSISSSHSTLSPTDTSNVNNSQQLKNDVKTKLKSIDMFSDLPKKGNLHQAHRNTAVTPTATPVKAVIENKSKTPSFVTNRKITRRHVGTQVVRKLLTKEIQTEEKKTLSSRYTQTDRRKTISKAVQTNPVSFNTTKSETTDAFERMKEIDMEIQALLQEKFKLYSSLESKESCPNTMQSLGMAVLNVASYDDEGKEEENENYGDTQSGDAIVEDFANIPVEELEQIALESVQEERNESVNVEARTRRQKLIKNDRKKSKSPTVKNDRKKSESPTVKSRNKKGKTPNISLLEQIIKDDRPLEDIISLDDLESTPAKSSKKKKSQPKKKSSKKVKTAKKDLNLTKYSIKECHVVLERIDASKFVLEVSSKKPVEQEQSNLQTIVEEPPKPEDCVKENEELLDDELILDHEAESALEEVINDIQFDMLDVSEDIVIGDSCDAKIDKDLSERIEVPICEEIILDNSQSSMDEAVGESEQSELECKVYDYSTDETLRRDTVTVTGHADSVLALECLDDTFLAACLDGNVYYFSGDGQLLTTLRGSNLAVTCLTVVKEKYGTTVYTGSLDSRIRYFDLETGLEKGPECNVLSPIQTMDRAWDTVFVGTRTGFVLQFECKNNMLIPVSTVKFSEQSILALKAMKEGPRKVLLVAARSERVTVKDAQTGLLLRTLQGPMMTVYTLMFEDGKVYCGTSTNQIHVFDYASGCHSGVHVGGKGAVCVVAAGGLVFAGCYDGAVYVFREPRARPLAQLRGPSNMLLALAIRDNKIIAGYKDRSLYIWKIPSNIIQEMIL